MSDIISKFDQIFVVFDNCLGIVKSGSREQKNIADFMPDYNLWYALKFSKTNQITILGDKDVSKSPMSDYIDTELKYLSIWLSQVTNIPCNYGYSYHGDWKYIFGYPTDKELIDHLRKPGKVLFIDRNTKTNKNYVKTKENLDYMCKDEFISLYNKNPKVYEKNHKEGRS